MLRHALLDDGVRYFHLGCFAMGLGIITKGVGFLPLLMLPFWLLAMRRASRWRSGGQRAGQLSWRELLIGLCWLLAAPLAWVGPMLVMSLLSADPELAAYRDNLLLKQTAERYADSWHHLKPWHYFLTQVIPWAWMPLLLTLPWWPKALATRLWRRDLRVWLPLSGAVLIVVFFSLSPASGASTSCRRCRCWWSAWRPCCPACPESGMSPGWPSCCARDLPASFWARHCWGPLDFRH
ncbi:hypothetical protein ACU8V3_12525 [Cobetia marina]